MKNTAKSSHIPVSKWIANNIQGKISAEWPEDVVKLAGSWKDDFPTLDEIRSTHVVAERPRKKL